MMETILTQQNVIMVFAAALLTMTLAFTFDLLHTLKTMGDK